MPISFSINQWSGWIPTEELDADGQSLSPCMDCSEKPDVAIIPAMLRRRLNTLGRAAAAELLKYFDVGGNIPVVYCSQHGDIERTLSVLETLAEEEPISPMHFSLAVHNAICGVLSIHTGNEANICSLAAGEQGVVPALLEAAGIIEEGAEKVLCIIADVRLPDIYYDASSKPKLPFTVSALISRANSENRFSLQLSEPTDSFSYQCPTELVAFLDSGKSSLALHHNGNNWLLKRDFQPA